MSLYADYLKERTEDRIIEGETGFVTYRYLEGTKSVYIVDIYIIPKLRKGGHAALLADLVAAEARERGCTEMLGTVVPTAKGSTTSIRVLLGYGMTLKSSANNMIVFGKDL